MILIGCVYLEIVLSWISKRIENEPTLFSRSFYRQWVQIIRTVQSRELIDNLLSHRNSLVTGSTKNGTAEERSNNPQSVSILSIELIMIYRDIGEVDLARKLVRSLIEEGFPEQVAKIEKQVWVDLLKFQLDKTKPHASDLSLPRLFGNPTKQALYCTDEAIRYYESRGELERADTYIQIRANHSWLLVPATPLSVFKRALETKSLSNVFLWYGKCGQLYMGFHSLASKMFVARLKGLDPESRDLFFKNVFSNKEFLPEETLTTIQRISRRSADKEFFGMTMDYILKKQPNLLGQLDTEKFILRVIYSKVHQAFLVNRDRNNAVSLSKMRSVVTMLLRYVTMIKRQLNESSTVNSDDASTGSQPFVYDKSAVPQKIFNTLFSRVTLPLSPQMERILLRESLRRGAPIGWQGLGSVLYQYIFEGRQEDAHKLIISVFRNIPRTCLVWILGDVKRDHHRGMFYVFAINAYSYLGRKDMALFITKELLRSLDQYGLITPSAHRGMVSVYIDSLGFNPNVKVDDIKETWNDFVEFGLKTSLSRQVVKPKSPDDRLIGRDGYIWSIFKDSIYGLNANNASSYIEALMRRGAVQDVLNFLFIEMPRIGLEPSHKLYITLLVFLNNKRFQMQLARVCVYFEDKYPHIVRNAHKVSWIGTSISIIIENSLKKIGRDAPSSTP